MLSVLFLLLFLLVLGALVLIHELGHFLMAKQMGVAVEEFAFGFPPRLWSTKRGETTYSVNAIPLGGYVRLRGEDGEVNDSRSFAGQTPGKRALIVVAGVLMNLVFAWLLLTLWFGAAAIWPPPQAVVVTEVLPNSAASAVGFVAGDIIQSVDAQAASSVAALQSATAAKRGQSVLVVYRHAGHIQTKAVVLHQDSAALGVAVDELGQDEAPDHVWQAPWAAVRAMAIVTWSTLTLLGSLIAGVFVNHQAAATASASVAGPVGIYGILAQMAALGWLYVVRLVGLLSLSLAIFNILPIPALDGGRLLFIGLEKLFRRRVVKVKVEQIAHLAGFALLLLLIGLISARDVLHLVRGS